MAKFKLGQTVFFFDKTTITVTKEVVYAIGKDFFIPEQYNYYLENYREMSFTDTFASIRPALAKLKAAFKEHCKKHNLKMSMFEVVEITPDLWQYHRKDGTDE